MTILRDPDKQRAIFATLPWCETCRGTGSVPEPYSPSGEGYCGCRRGIELAKHDEREQCAKDCEVFAELIHDGLVTEYQGPTPAARGCAKYLRAGLEPCTRKPTTNG